MEMALLYEELVRLKACPDPACSPLPEGAGEQ
jgi:hypothetical protein